MTADRTTIGDTDAEVTEEPAAPERRTPADAPGADGAPSRADSRAGAAAANDTTSSRTDQEPGEDKPEAAQQDVGSTTEPEPAGSVAAPESAAAVGTGTDDSAPSVEGTRKDRSAFPDEVVGEEQERPEAEESGARADVTDGIAAEIRPSVIWGSQDTRPSTEAAFRKSAAQSTDSPSTAEVTGPLERRDRPDAAAERPMYPEVTDRSDYAFTDREYAFAGISPQQAWDMHERRTPLGTQPEQWAMCTGELHEALATEGITDADVRLKGSAARFCSENPKKSFPQTEDELRAKVTDHYRNAPPEERTRRTDNAVATYREAGFAEDGGKPAAPFFDSMYELDATNEPSDYDFQVASDGLADRFQQFEKADPKTGWRSEHGGHYKHRHLERVAPALHDWAGRWEGILGRDVTIATFDHRGPATGLHDSDWKVIELEEQTNR
ncbi:hypothetical protein [Actinomadura sp. DC4]|uniref:hypothetical protein n=1 Tax=Actinomadura sp. DC4 TaxID=3055069 RepID=UPI0025B00FFF|nr:hypothetical protein [Actinomadura sp. DC4]MDN3355110.1 hypothetical protein [Actinomadura sp. DC4]